MLYGKNVHSTTFTLLHTLHYLYNILIFMLMIPQEIQAAEGPRDSGKRPRAPKMPAYTHGISKTSTLSTAEASFSTATSPAEPTKPATC